MKFKTILIRVGILAVSILLTLVQQNTFAADVTSSSSNLWDIGKTAGMKFFNPDDVLTGSIRFQELPEIEAIHRDQPGDVGRQIGKLADFLKYNGIPLGLGVNSNRDSFFDLYAPYVDILLDEPAAEFGQTRQSEVGKMHFLTHDSLHLYAGSPGLKKSDLKNREETKKRLTNDLMKLEAIGSVWTAMNHVKWYWDWRETQGMTEAQKEEFRKYNKGLSSLGEFHHQDMMDLLDAYMGGRFGEMRKLYSKNVDLDTYLKAKEAGVPLLFPDLKEKLGVTGERLVVKYGLPILMPLFHMYDKKFGYVNLIKYAGMQADFYMSDWYVEWTDEFHVGQDLGTLEANIQRKMDDFRNQKFFSDVPTVKNGVFEVMFMRNSVAQFGRKLIELEYLERQRIAQGRPQLDGNDWNELKSLHRRALQFNNAVLNLRAEGRDVSSDEIKAYRESALGLFSEAQAALPLDKILPLRDRLAHADYSNFWFDSFSVVLPRPDGLTKFLSARGLWKEALRQRLQRKEMEAKGKTYQEVDLEKAPVVVGELETQLAARYNENRRGAVVEPQNFSENYYLNKLLNYKNAIQAQVKMVFIPQMMEASPLNHEQQSEMIAQAENFLTVFNARLDEFGRDYHRLFVSYERDPAAMERLVNTESDLKWAVDRSLNSMADILDMMESGASGKNILKSWKVVNDITARLQSRAPMTRGVQDILRNVLPYKKGTSEMLCSMITRLCFKSEKLNDFFDHMPRAALAGQKDAKVEITTLDKKGQKTAAEALPEDAIIILALNHDHALMDLASMKDVARSLQVETVSVLTNKEVWPIYNVIKNKDETALFKQDKNLKQRVLDLATQSHGRFVFAIYPEGDLPYFGANFPVVSHLGAFSIARSVAVAQKGRRPVYLVKAISNFQKAIQSQGRQALEIELMAPELVPTQDISGRDAWVENERASFEKVSLEKRGSDMLDLIARKKNPQMRTRSTAPVSEYRSAGQFMSNFMKMDAGAGAISCQGLFLR
jgi:hypothetical protein